VIETEGLAQFDDAFRHASSSTDPGKLFHHAVNSPVKGLFFALYRDFPGPGHECGEERF
jgi:hypothetical protein